MSDPKRRLGVWLLAIFGAAIVGAWLAPSSPPERKSFAEVLAELTRMGFTPGILISFVLWTFLSLYWELAGRSETTAREPFRSRFVHLALTSLAQLLLLLPLPGLRQRFLPMSASFVAVGLAIEFASVALAVWSRRTLGRHWSGAIATNVDHELVKSGPYRWVRHPIYTAILGLCVGTAIVSGEVHALLGLVVAGIAYARKIRMEEAHLAAHFGPAYADYRQRTSMLVPKII